VLKLFFAFFWVHLASVLRLELSILIANFQVADRMLRHLGIPHDHELRAQIARL